MKVLIVLSSVLALAVANAYYGHDAGYGYGAGHGHGALVLAPTAKVIHAQPVNTGYSNSYRQQDSWGNYKFGYDEQHSTGGSSRKEEGDSWGNKVGSYSLNVGDGRKRVVKYVADGHGFRASISSNEPGVVAKAAADTSISTPHGHSAAPVYGHAAPVVAAYSHAPVAYAAAPVAYAAAPAHAYAAPAHAYAAPAHAYAAPAYGYAAAPAYGAHGY